jgi:hypothetical protein
VKISSGATFLKSYACVEFSGADSKITIHGGAWEGKLNAGDVLHIDGLMVCVLAHRWVYTIDTVDDGMSEIILKTLADASAVAPRPSRAKAW